MDRFLERVQKVGLADDIWRDYYEELASLIPGAVRKSFRTASGYNYETVVFGPDPGANDFVPLADLAPKKEEWFAAMARAIQEIKKAFEEKNEPE